MLKEKKRIGKYCVVVGCMFINVDNILVYEFLKEIKCEF